jgi:hypothetical protein
MARCEAGFIFARLPPVMKSTVAAPAWADDFC